MLRRVEAKEPENVLLPVGKRPQAGVYFLRLAAYSPAVGDFLRQVHEAARQKGAVIDEHLANPDGQQLSRLNAALGNRMELSAAFLEEAAGKWLPRMSADSRRAAWHGFCAM